MSPPASDLLLLDASFLLSWEGLGWLQEDPEARRQVIISQALARSLQGEAEIDLDSFLAEEDREIVGDSRERISAFIQEVPTFSHQEARLIEPWDDDVRRALVDEGGTNGEILADEWSFLVSHSWMAAKLQYPLDKFRDAGAVVVSYGRRFRDQMIRTVVPSEHVPTALTRGFEAKVTAKWLVVAGPTAVGATIFPPAAFGSLIAVPFVRAFDP